MPKRSLVLPFGTLMATMAAGYGALFSMLDDFRDEYGIGETALGAVIGIGFLAGFVSQILIAPLADRGHARRLVVVGALLNIAGLLLMAAASSFVPLLAGRFVMGIGVGTAYPAVRRIVIIAEPERLGHNIGRLLAADVAGFAMGPAISAILVGPFGIPAPFVVIAVGTALVLPVVLRTRVEESVDESGQRFAFDLLRIRPFAGAVTLACAVFLMIGAFDALWAVVLDDLDATEWLANLGIIMFALPLVVLGSLGGRLSQRLGPFRVGIVGLLGGATFMFLYGVMPTAAAMFTVAMVHSLSDALTVSSTGVAVGMVVPAERQAGAQGVMGGLQTLTAGVTALVIGAVYEHAGRFAAYGATSAGMLVLVAVGWRLARPAIAIRGAGEASRDAALLDTAATGALHDGAP